MAKKSATVRIRGTDSLTTVPITAEEKPEIIDLVTDKWQRIISLVARLMEVPSALVMRINETNMEVFLKSQNNDNPYPQSGTDELGNGLYCETVIGSNEELLVSDALASETWRKNPDVKIGMISYYGLPIRWPDDECFGTICVLDSKPNCYNTVFKELMNEFRLSIEKDLELLISRNELQTLSERDTLTSLNNRRKSTEVLISEFKRSTRYKTSMTIALIDLDEFKSINDSFGHEMGDKVLQVFAESAQKGTRSIDVLGRWGGDEFLLICPNTNSDGITSLLANMQTFVREEVERETVPVTFSYGVAEFQPTDSDPNDMLRRADDELYKAKSRR